MRLGLGREEEDRHRRFVGKRKPFFGNKLPYYPIKIRIYRYSCVDLFVQTDIHIPPTDYKGLLKNTPYKQKLCLYPGMEKHVNLTIDDVRHVCRLSALEVPEGELEQLKQDLASILDFVAKLSQVNTQGVLPTSHVHGAVNAFRKDIVKDSLPVEDALSNAPDSARDSFRVPRII